MLLPLQIPLSTGSTENVILNVGDMENKGIEFALGWHDKIKTLNYKYKLDSFSECKYNN